MKSNLISPILGVLLVLSVLAVLPSGPKTLAGGTIYVDDDNVSGIEDGTLANPFNTIQEGVDAAAAGDTVFVFNGTYHENVWFDKTIVLQGEDPAITVIDTGTLPPMSDYPAITAVADDVSISGFTTINGKIGIAAGLASGISIYYNIMTTQKGLEILNLTYGNIHHNTVMDTAFGIFVFGTSNCTFSDNNIENVSFCMDINDSPDNLISQNNITDGGFCINLHNCENSVVTENTVVNGSWAVKMDSCNNSLISHNTFVEGNDGIFLYETSGVTIAKNNLSENSGGIELSDADYCTITENTITHNLKRGLDMRESENNTITDNMFSHNEYGIVMDFDSNTNLVFNNSLHSHSNSGMYLSSSAFNTIANNTVHSNLIYGIYLRGSFNHNLIVYNYVHSNIEEGIFAGHSPKQNLIYHNHLENNNGATTVYNSSHKQTNDLSGNSWDDGYPSGGNYYSDWLSPDAFSGPLQDVSGKDGIVDEPYYLNNLAQDNYPLTRSPLGPAGPPSATIDIDPDTLNLKSKGKWITCYIELPYGYDPRDINASTILLNETVPPELNPKYGFVKNESGYIMDHDNDTIEERMVKFPRSAVEEMLGQPYESIALNVTGELKDGTPFSGYDTIRVIDPPKKKP